MIPSDRLDKVRERLRCFNTARDWSEFHDPKNLAMAIASEAGELLATLRWIHSDASDEFVYDPSNRLGVEQEVADVAITPLNQQEGVPNARRRILDAARSAVVPTPTDCMGGF